MQLVVLDLDVIRDTEALLNHHSATIHGEAQRHSALAGDVEHILSAMAGEILSTLNPANWFDPMGPWDRWGLQQYRDSSATSHAIVDEVRATAQQQIHTLAEAHGSYGRYLAERAADAIGAVERAAAAAGEAATFFSPFNLLTMLHDPRSVRSMYSFASNLLHHASDDLSELGRFLDRLYQREEEVLREIAQPIGAGVVTFFAATSRNAATFMTRIESTVTQDGKSLLEYLGQKYHGSTSVSLYDEHHHLDPHATAGVNGNLWESKFTRKGNVGPIPVSEEDGIVVADLSLVAGAQTWGDGEPMVGAQGEFTAIKGYQKQTIGNKWFGLTNNKELDIGQVDGHAGFQDGSVGWDIGGSAVTYQESRGVNIAGINVGVNGSLGLKAELGFELGKHVEVKLPFASFGFSIDSAQ